MGLLSATTVQAQNYNTKCLGISAGYAPRPQRMGNQREHSLPHSFRRSILGISLSRYRISKLEGKCVTKR